MTDSATHEQAWQFIGDMQAQTGARIVTRTDAIEYRMIRAAIESATLGAVDVEQLLENYSQTIGPLVYLAPKHAADPDTVMSVVVHELEHVHQFFRDGLSFAWLYLTTQEGRATYEAHAYSSQFEWNHARYGSLPASIEALAMPLEAPAYLLGPDEIKLARKLIEQRMTSVAHGHYNGFSALAAIAWARKHAPTLLVHP